MREFSAKLEKLCDERGWDRAELARRIGVSKTAAGNYFDGIRKPFRDTLKILTDVLGVSADYLINDELDEPPTPVLSDDERRIVDCVREREIPFLEAMDALLAKARKLEQARTGPLFGNVRFTGPDAENEKTGKGRKA